jgi:hypothetical protein
MSDYFSIQLGLTGTRFSSGSRQILQGRLVAIFVDDIFHACVVYFEPFCDLVVGNTLFSAPSVQNFLSSFKINPNHSEDEKTNPNKLNAQLFLSM